MLDKKCRLVSVMTAGKITKVMKKTIASAVKNSQASKNAFFIIIKKAPKSECLAFGLLLIYGMLD